MPSIVLMCVRSFRYDKEMHRAPRTKRLSLSRPPGSAAGHKNTHPSWSCARVTGVTKRKWLLLILGLPLIRGRHAHTLIQTQRMRKRRWWRSQFTGHRSHVFLNDQTQFVFFKRTNCFLPVVAEHLGPVSGKSRFLTLQTQSFVNFLNIFSP